MNCSVRILLGGAALLAATCAGTADAANRGGDFSISPVIGGITFDGPQHLATRPFFGIRGGYNFTDHFGVEALFDYARTRSTIGGPHANFFRYGGEMLYHFMPERDFVPYVAAGYAGVNFDESRATMFKSTRGAFDYGLGLKYFISDRIALRGDVRHLVYRHGDTRHTVEYSVGLHIPFGAPPPAAAPARTAPEGERAAPGGAVPEADMRDSGPEQPAAPGGPAGPAVQSPAVPPQPSQTQQATFKYCVDLNLQFDIDRTEIRAEYHDEIARVGEFMKRYGTTTATIAGHTDDVGTREHNEKLSLARAESVKRYLVEHFGIDRGRIATKAYGPTKPAVESTTDEGRQKNRRIEAIIECAFDATEVTPPDTLCMQLRLEFDKGSSAIGSRYHGEIGTVAEYLKKYPSVTALIEGHTDNTGSSEANMRLSRKRAESVLNYLVDKFGIERSRLSAVGYGETRRIAYNSTPEGRRMNRRINVIVDCVVKQSGERIGGGVKEMGKP